MPLPLFHLRGTVMKHINIKRVLLNIGMTIFVIAAGFLIHQLYEISFLRKAEGVVTGTKVLTNWFYVDENNAEENMLDYYIEYTDHQGGLHTDTKVGRAGDYKTGGTVEIKYDKRAPDDIAYPENNTFFIGVFGIPGVLLIFFCRSAFRGYKTEYLDRYKKTVLFSVVSGLVPIAYYIYYEFFFEPSGIMFAGLGEAILCIFLFIAVPVINIIVWIISAALYCRRCKKSEVKGSAAENGSEQRSDI